MSLPRPPLRGRWSARIAAVSVGLATAWFALAAAWGIGAIPGGGHLGSSGAAVAIAGEHIVRFRTLYPLADWYTSAEPGLDRTYCHHPFGVFWIAAALAWLWPHMSFVVQLPAVLMSAAMPALLYGIGRRVGGPSGGPVAGVAAAVAFVAVPLDVGYACFASLEVTVMFGAALFFWGHLAYQASGLRRHLVAALVGVLFASLGDWPGYLILAPMLAWGLARAYLLPARVAPPVAPAQRRAVVAAVVLSLACLGGTLALFAHAHQLGEWLGAGAKRGNAAAVPLATVLAGRAAWLEFSFTPLVIALGKIALPVCVVRALVLRRDEELMALAALFGAAVQYVVFRQGADIHIFWPHYFGLYFALAMAQLADSARWAVLAVAREVSPRRAATAALVAAVLVGVVPSLVVLPDAARALVVWRQTGGRYDDRGALFRSHVDLLFVLAEVVRPRLALGEKIGVHPGTQWGPEHQWALMGNAAPANAPSASQPFWVGRASGMGADELRALVAGRHVRIYGDVLLVERGVDDEPAPLDAFSLHEREPTLVERYLTHNTEPVRTLDAAPDAFLTWEWRVHLGQPATAPTAAPRTLDETRIAHDVAVDRGDAAEAARLRAIVEAALDRTRAADFVGGHRLLGVRLPGGVKPEVESWFLAAGPVARDATFEVTSTVVARLPTSLVPVDPTVRSHAFAPSLSTKLWRPGFLYRMSAELKHRIGEERYTGAFSARAPIPTTSGARQIELAVLR